MARWYVTVTKSFCYELLFALLMKCVDAIPTEQYGFRKEHSTETACSILMTNVRTGYVPQSDMRGVCRLQYSLRLGVQEQGYTHAGRVGYPYGYTQPSSGDSIGEQKHHRRENGWALAPYTANELVSGRQPTPTLILHVAKESSWSNKGPKN